MKKVMLLIVLAIIILGLLAILYFTPLRQYLPDGVKPNENGKLFPYIVIKPVDESGQNPDFAAFRKELLKAITRKDVGFITAHLYERIHYSFGPADNNIAGFLKEWKLENTPEESEFWDTLKTILLMGGRFEKNGDFTAPYTFTDYPFNFNNYDSLGYCILLDKDVQIFLKPNLQSKIIGYISYEVVKYGQLPNKIEVVGWVPIVTSSGIKGFIKADKQRSPIDYRVSFRNFDGTWKMVFFVAGD